MMQARLMTIIRSPVVSEKANTVFENGKNKKCVAFKVLPNATKAEIKAAVELLFDAKVSEVRTLNVTGKKRRTAHGMGVRSDWKKAYVTFAEGQEIDLNAQAAEQESK